MRISRVIISNYRNLKNVDVRIESLVTLIGENNSGKSNFLKAITLPFLSDDTGTSKQLSWYDINDDAKSSFYEYVSSKRKEIVNGTADLDELSSQIPKVIVKVELEAADTEHYDLKDLYAEERDGQLIASIQYCYCVDKKQQFFERIRELLSSDLPVEDIKMSLLPIEMFIYSITIPGKDCKVPYDMLRNFRFVALQAERDSFAANSDRLGSRALVDILKSKLTPSAQVNIEKEYSRFFDSVREAGRLNEVLNWQDYSDIPNAKRFFDEISILPNIPTMSSILGSIKLGYNDENLALQGLGYRNLVLMMVILNSYLSKPHDISLRLVTVEEPEAHLCISNILLMASFFNIFSQKNGYTQLIYSTHSAEFINKIGLDKTIVIHGGTAYSLKDEISKSERDYLANNPNTDVFKILFSRRVILVEGITEELLIKSYLQTKPEMNEIKVISFHKGYKDIIKIWKKINVGSSNRLGVVRDSDGQHNAQREHEALQDDQVIVCTTSEYTLEPEIVKAGDNFELLKEKYGSIYGWLSMGKDELQEDWRNRKTDVILRICHDLVNGELQTFTMPSHIQRVLDFMQSSDNDNTPGSIL